MSADQYVLWFIAMAVLIALLLGLGTLRMAGILHRRAPRTTEEERTGQVIEHHHWYDRFHHHHHAA